MMDNDRLCLIDELHFLKRVICIKVISSCFLSAAGWTLKQCGTIPASIPTMLLDDETGEGRCHVLAAWQTWMEFKSDTTHGFKGTGILFTLYF